MTPKLAHQRGGKNGQRARQDSNLRPLAPEASALSTELRARARASVVPSRPSPSGELDDHLVELRLPLPASGVADHRIRLGAEPQHDPDGPGRLLALEPARHPSAGVLGVGSAGGDLEREPAALELQSCASRVASGRLTIPSRPSEQSTCCHSSVSRLTRFLVAVNSTMGLPFVIDAAAIAARSRSWARPGRRRTSPRRAQTEQGCPRRGTPHPRRRLPRGFRC